MRNILPFKHFLEVEWEDAASNDGWIGKEEDTTPETIISRGWLVKEAEGYVTIAAAIHKNDDHEYGSTQTIPRGMIRVCRELKVTNARRKS